LVASPELFDLSKNAVGVAEVVVVVVVVVVAGVVEGVVVVVVESVVVAVTLGLETGSVERPLWVVVVFAKGTVLGAETDGVMIGSDKEVEVSPGPATAMMVEVEVVFAGGLKPQTSFSIGAEITLVARNATSTTTAL
jgi:hypothetical protein